ncbi:MAG: TIGR00730 family Rossman fold protein [Planctomycetota bacterium]|nr:TIGR00730 family Rossman fold protein [Planctomycetota bacterium]
MTRSTTPVLSRVTVYCGSASGNNPSYTRLAEETGIALAHAGIELVYGGGGIGLMGAVARSAKSHGGRVTGIITEQFLKLEQGWTGCDELIVVPSMAERKHILIERADAFLVLPGGLGTYEEFFETLVGRVIGRHPAPIGLLDQDGYFEPLEQLLDHAVASGFARKAARACVVRGSTAHELLERFRTMESLAHSANDFLPMHGHSGS